MSAFGHYADQAAREALLRFGPQRSNLAELIREAQQGYASHLGQARTRALGTKAAINHAIPEIRQIFSGAEGASQGTANLLTHALEGASPDSPYRQSQASESALALQQLVARKAAEESRLKQEGVGAQSGLQFAGLAAQQNLAHELRSLLQKRGTLSGEEGAFASSQADKAAKEAAKEAAAAARAARSDETTRRGQDLTRKSAEEAHSGKGGKGGGKGAKPLTQVEHNAGKSTVSAIRDLVSETRQHLPKITRAELVRELRLGHPAAEGQPAIPAYKPSALMAAGLDLALYGGVTRNTEARLRSEGYVLRKLGFPRVKAGAGVTGSNQAGG